MVNSGYLPSFCGEPKPVKVKPGCVVVRWCFRKKDLWARNADFNNDGNGKVNGPKCDVRTSSQMMHMCCAIPRKSVCIMSILRSLMGDRSSIGMLFTYSRFVISVERQPASALLPVKRSLGLT